MSLQQQLKRLGTADLRNVTEISRRHKASFLFSSREAADQDLDTIYSIAYNGIMELVIMDSKFSAFENTLFSETMKSVDRVLQTKEENESLDASINSFLQQLSPYFLLKPAGKVLEWLIRRFSIHEFNIEGVLTCILPYHETKPFVKMVSLLKIEDQSPWEFLKPLKKSELPLERSLLIKKLYKDRYVLDFICNMVISSPVSFQTLYAFFAATLTDYLRLATSVTDEMTIALMPHLIDSLTARNTPELQIAAYMIISQLASKASFSHDGLRAITDPMIRKCSKSFFSYSLLTVVHLAQTQPSFHGLGKSAADKLLNSASFHKDFLDIAKKYATDRFLTSLMPKLCTAVISNSKHAEFLEQLVLHDYISSANIRLLCECALDGYLEVVAKPDCTEESKKSYIANFHALLITVSQRRVDDLDAVLDARLKASSGLTKSQSKAFYEFTSAAFKGTRHEVVGEGNTTLYLCLNSPAVTARLLAMKKLVDIMGDKTSPLLQSPDVIESAFAGCLENFDDLLSYAVSEVPGHLLDHVSSSKILKSLARLLHERGALKRKEAVQIVTFLLKEFAKRYPKEAAGVARLVALFIFAAPSENVATLTKQVGDLSFKKTAILQTMLVDTKKAAGSTKTSSDVAIAFIRSQAEHLQKNDALSAFWLDMIKDQTISERVIGLLVLGHAVLIAQGDKQPVLVVNTNAAIFSSLTLQEKNDLYSSASWKQQSPDNEDFLSTALVQKLRNVDDMSQTLVINLIQRTLLSMTTSLKRVDSTIEWFTNSTSVEAPHKHAVIELFKASVGGAQLGCFETMVVKLISNQFKEDLLSFLISIWTDSDAAPIVRARALQITASYISHRNAQDNAHFDYQHILPALIPVLSEDNIDIRSQGMQCLESVFGAYKNVSLPSGRKVYEVDTAVDGKPSRKSTAKASIVSASSIYGSKKTDVPDLRSNDAAHFVDYIWLRHQEIKQDKSYINGHIKAYFKLCEESDDKQNRTRGTHVLDSLLKHTSSAPRVDMQYRLMQLLQGIETPRILTNLAPLLEAMLNGPRTITNTPLVALLISAYQPCNAPALGGKGDKTLPLFLRLLSNQDVLEGEDEDGWQVSTRRFALQQITHDFFEQASDKAKKSIFSVLVDIATNGQQNEVLAAKRVFADISLSAKMLEDALMATAKALAGTVSEAAKRQRTETVSKAVDLYELVTVLELIESKAITNDHLLVKPLFEILTAMVNADLRDAPVSLEYINQLLMSSLTRIIQSAEENHNEVEESALRVDTVVQCIRSTENPQTHNHALLLMATVASMYPECVLHNIMQVFTFMGANVLRQDDNYSFQVIQQTLEKIIPPLVASSRLSSENEVALALQVKPIIKVFVDALFHIPKHRRLRLFSVLIQTLGEDEFLYAIISLLLEKFTEKLARGARTEAESLTEFSLTIAQQFGVETQMKAILALLTSLLALPNEKPDDAVMDETNLFNVNEHNAKQLRQYKLATVNFVSQLLASKGFLSKVMVQSNTVEGFEEMMQPYYLEAVEQSLKIVASFTEFRDRYAVSEGANAVVAKFWRAIPKVVYDVLEKINALLPVRAFAGVISHLSKHPEAAVRRRAMAILNQKIISFEGRMPEDDEGLLISLISDLTVLIETEDSKANDEDSSINKQSALMCISSLAKLCGGIYPAQFADAIPIIIGDHGLRVANAQLKVSCLVALTIICQEIGPRAVPHLPKFMPAVIDVLSVTVNAENPNVMLQLSVVSALEAIVETLPHFVSPYLPKMLSGLLHPSTYVYDAADSQKAMVKDKVAAVISGIASNVPPRVLLNPVFACYASAVKNGKDSTLALYSLVSQAIRSMSRDVVTTHYKQIFKFFLVAFDMRREHGETFEEAEIDEMESSIVTAFLDLVMKLNETLFKPLFLKVVDWATMELAVEGQTFGEDAKKRVLFFYKLLDALLEKLKSIFTPYFGYVIDDLISRLQRYVDGEDEPDALWNQLVTVLRKSFLYDTDNLWNAEKFEKILDPVVDQMLVTSAGDADSYLTRMTTYLVPCIGQMAVTVSNDTLWKPLNHKVLMKSREEAAEIRLAALRCIEEFYSRLGEEWLLFLAESISFLAELMEDDDIRVEKLVQQVNAQIETHLGESLDKFFN
ncbi:HEAT repeat-containing protein 1 [Apophysomyces sp. BC1034]|nr:HEAT repeat-containing protein 1 [Apophysomyces sp. BC1015]KAG0171315.1 HEAT repeat-containing protein 1 [Apophysomyces sp. BC1021]KAG0184762.1 HEAT repeat-containing protein 1 [Apophysomyces sp. BC1034]